MNTEPASFRITLGRPKKLDAKDLALRMTSDDLQVVKEKIIALQQENYTKRGQIHSEMEFGSRLTRTQSLVQG
jgi:hypothetical protein